MSVLAPFHPTVQRWFRERLGEPSPPQREGWPRIREGNHTLIAAPTGTGKTLAAFLWAVNELLQQGASLADETQVLYISPLKALGNDVQKNLRGPLDELTADDGEFPEVRVLVRSGDTPQSERVAMRKRPPHILVTTPESLYILLTSDGGREMLRTVRTVIVDEIHAIAGDKRGAHLALSLERLSALVDGKLQRIGLSATQKPISDVARLLVGVGRECTTVDVGHRRELDLALEVPESPLETVCSHETWEEIYRRMAELIGQHRTTLVFVNTRKLAERVAARLTGELGEEQVTSHHGSLSRERRLDAEQRLKQGGLRALVATASLELGIDIGDVDLVVQVGITPSIATLLQRVGRSGHALSRTPKGRLFPLTQDELVCAVALLDAVERGELDRTPQPGHPLDILAQQIVAACVGENWDEATLYDTMRTAWPYRELTREAFDSVVALHTDGRYALLHRDGVNGRLRATRRARITALTSGGAIPDVANYRVLLEPEGVQIGTLDEDFSIESSAGDIFQLGNNSWQILKIEAGVVRVSDARGAPPTVPFWFGEAPARTRELSAAIARVRREGGDEDWLKHQLDLPEGAADQLVNYLEEGQRVLGAVPTTKCVVLERFFDESGGMQLVLHAPFGGRINRAWGLALRKRFCRGFGFELQAAANEEAIVLSLGPMHSFPLDEVFDYLHPNTVRKTLVQALLPAPMFGARWRWNLTRSLMLPRTQNGGKRVPTPLLRMRADDRLAQAFPEVLACGETLPPGDLPVPWEHPLVRQTIEDCLTEAMDIHGLIEVLEQLQAGRIRRVAVDTPTPSVFARGILNAMPYAFLDDAPLEERRTQAVLNRRVLDVKTADSLGVLDADAVERVRQEAWPDADTAEEVHEALCWMGYVTVEEADRSGWDPWIEELHAAGRVQREQDRWFAVEARRDPKSVLRGRLEALGPVVVEDDPLLRELEVDGSVLRCRLEGTQAWCDRRLLARIQRYTLDRLRESIRPVTAGQFWRFLGAWQHVEPGYRLEGPRGVSTVIGRLAGFELAAAEWEKSVLPARIDGYRGDWLDQLTLTGELVWGRLWSAGNVAVRSAPVCLLHREDLELWLELAGRVHARQGAELSSYARTVLSMLTDRGPSFTRELQHAAGLLPEHFEMGLVELIGNGRITCDSFGGLRRLITAPSKRRGVMKRAPLAPAGRWSVFRDPTAVSEQSPRRASEAAVELVARTLLDRYGVVFRRLLTRERIPLPWRDLVRVYRHQELRGDLRGGRFVQRFSGEQFALPSAAEQLRRHARREVPPPSSVCAADPLNLRGVLTPDERVSAQSRQSVMLGGSVGNVSPGT